MGRNLWEVVAKEVRGGPMALYLWVIGMLAFIVGAVLSYEDFMSSYYGLVSLQTSLGVQVVSHPLVLVVMAITPWIGQIVFVGLWTLDTSRRWALVAGIIWFVLDFVSDVQFRSGNTLIPLPGTQVAQSWGTIGVSAGITFLYFTVGAELFITAASAIVLTLFPDAVREFASTRARARKALYDARQIMNGTNQRPQKPDNSQRPQGNTGRPQRPDNSQRPQGNAGRPQPPVISQELLSAIDNMD